MASERCSEGRPGRRVAAALNGKGDSSAACKLQPPTLEGLRPEAHLPTVPAAGDAKSGRRAQAWAALRGT